jgi:orotate phosphoribosyltransferase/signal transduction histidine kinase
MSTFRFGRLLTLPSWEADFGRQRVPPNGDGSWSPHAPADGLKLEFTDVEFADFGALARSLLLLAGATRAGATATVTLPAADLTAGEKRHVRHLQATEHKDADHVLRQLDRTARARSDALAFMRQVGFIDCLEALDGQTGSILILDGTDSAISGLVNESGSADEIVDRRPQDEPYQPRRVMPFHWIGAIERGSPRESETFRSIANDLQDLGLSGSDAEALSQTVLTELVENFGLQSVEREREPPPTLLGAILLTAQTHKLRQHDMPAQFRELAECAMADGSHILRLIVANSAAPLIDDLIPIPGHDDALSDPELAQAAARVQDGILRAFGQWSAGAGDSDVAKRVTHGMWRLARVVRSYRGSVLMRTAGLTAGMFYNERASEGVPIRDRGLGPVPGALFEVSILTDPQIQPAELQPGYSAGTHEATRMHWIPCTLDPRRGLSGRDQSRLRRAARDLSQDSAVSGIVATVSVPDRDLAGDARRAALSALFDAARRAAGRAAIAVLLHTVDPRVLDVEVAGINEAIDAGDGMSAPIPSPILVLGSHGDALWCGGSRPLRVVLARTAAANGMLTKPEAEQLWADSGGKPEEFGPALEDHGQLLATRGERLSPRLSPPTVYATLAETAGRDLSQVITEGGDGVETGKFRGPTLRITSRWIDTEQLLGGTVSASLASFILARKVTDVLTSSAPFGPPTVVVQLASTPWLIVKQLSECLSLGGRYYSLPAELDTGDLPDSDRVPAHAGVVLCTDVISTENSVRRAAAAVAGGHAEPLIIACLVDARERHGPVLMQNRSIPVVALTEADFSFPAGRAGREQHATDIDPLLLRPYVRGSAATRHGSVSETDLLRWCAADPETLRLGHVAWPPHRHFSALVLLDHVVRHQKIRNKITDAFLRVVDDALAEIAVMNDRPGISDASLEVWYVRSRDGNAGRLATAVHDRLVAHGRKVSSLVAIPRATAGDTWAFPAAVSEPDGTQPAILVVGWSTVTGATLLQTIRLAAKRGASCIVAVSMLHQLDVTDAEALEMLRAVADSPVSTADTGTRGEHPQTATSTLITPMAIRFVTVSSITVLPAHDCAICATQEAYEVSDEAAPERLRRHADKLRDLLRPRSIEEVSGESAADLYSVPVVGADVVDFLRWRGLLLRALRELPARYEVIERLQRLTRRAHATSWTRLGLIRLLAAEQQWLKLPPLRFEVAKKLLSDACMLDLEGSGTESDWLRAQTLIVLFANGPDDLLEKLPRLLPLIADVPVLLDQMLLDFYHLLMHPPRDYPLDVEHIRRSLVRFRDDLEQLREQKDPSSIDEVCHVINELIVIASYRTLRKPTDAQAAWEQLREDLMRPVSRHGLESDLLLVRNFVEDLQEAEPTPEAVRKAHRNWDTCARQLEERAIVCLPGLRDILTGDYVSDWLGPREYGRLRQLIETDVAGLRAVTGRLHRLTSEPWQPAYPPWQALRQELLDRINWWNRMFLATHIAGHHVPALLVDLVRSAPVSLAARVTAVLSAHGAEAAIEDADVGAVAVFCPEKLVDEIVAHLIENVRRHCPDNAPCRISVSYQRADIESARLVFRNTGTRPRTPPGQGLNGLNDKLRPFGGALVSRVPESGEWSFEAVVKFPLWNIG